MGLPWYQIGLLEAQTPPVEVVGVGPIAIGELVIQGGLPFEVEMVRFDWEDVGDGEWLLSIKIHGLMKHPLQGPTLIGLNQTFQVQPSLFRGILGQNWILQNVRTMLLEMAVHGVES